MVHNRVHANYDVYSLESIDSEDIVLPYHQLRRMNRYNGDFCLVTVKGVMYL